MRLGAGSGRRSGSRSTAPPIAVMGGRSGGRRADVRAVRGEGRRELEVGVLGAAGAGTSPPAAAPRPRRLGRAGFPRRPWAVRRPRRARRIESRWRAGGAALGRALSPRCCPPGRGRRARSRRRRRRSAALPPRPPRRARPDGRGSRPRRRAGPAGRSGRGCGPPGRARAPPICPSGPSRVTRSIIWAPARTWVRPISGPVAVDGEAQHALVEAQHGGLVADPQHDVVEAADAGSGQLR